MEKRCLYMVKRDENLPTLLRIQPDAEDKVYRSGSFEKDDQFYWIYTPELEDIITHRDRFSEYKEISDEKAKEIIQQLKMEFARAEEAKHVVNVEHSQKQTEKGVVYIDTYSKGAERRSFRTMEIEKLLSGLAGKEYMVVQHIHYSFFDFWGYQKHRTATNIEDIHEICASLAIDGYFADREMIYRFMYLDADNKVIIAKCRKETGIDLQAVFDDKTNQQAGGYISDNS